jgi:hypothetical protein
MHGTVFNGTLSGNYILGAHLIVDSYFGYTRLDNSQEPVSLDKG